MELKPCPFCGGSAIMRERFIHGSANTKHYRLECIECHASFRNWYKNKNNATAAWNRRADVAPVVRGNTNADRIRGMTDEDLAEMLTGDREWLCEIMCGKVTICGGNCKEKALNWLRQPAETEGTE